MPKGTLFGNLSPLNPDPPAPPQRIEWVGNLLVGWTDSRVLYGVKEEGLKEEGEKNLPPIVFPKGLLP